MISTTCSLCLTICLLSAGGDFLPNKEADGSRNSSLESAAEAIIVEDGKPRATIVLGSSPSDSERAAARELQTYLGKIASCDGQKVEKLPIRTEGEACKGIKLFVGKGAWTKRLATDLSGLGPRGFILQSLDDGLVLCGKEDLGTEFAVYTFLEKYCGVRWLWPGKLGEHVPRRKTVSMPCISDKQEPDFQLTLLRADPLWKKRNKLVGGMNYVGGHNWGKMVPPDKYGPRHPEYFALVKGTRQRDWKGYDGQHGYQLCTSNPAVIKICVDHVRRYFDAHPRVDMYSVAANDGSGWCECDACRALDHGKTVNGVRAMTDRVFLFTNQIAAELKKSHPDKYLVQLAYQACLEPPQKVKPAENVAVMIAVNLEGNYSSKHKDNHWRLFRRWSKVSDNLFVYEYFNHTWKLQLPRAMPKAIGEAIDFYRKNGSSMFYAQSMNDFFSEGLDYYLTAKLLWDASRDPDDIVDDYCRSAFGDAAQSMKKYFYRLEELWGDEMRTKDYWHHGSGASPGNPDDYLAMFSPEAMQELKGYLQESLRLAQPGEYQQRVKFMLKGWQFTELEVDAFRSLRGLAQKEIITYQKGAPAWRGEVKNLAKLDMPEEEAKRLIANTISLWQARDRCAKELENTFVIDYGHIRAWNCIDDRYNPVERLEKALARSKKGKRGRIKGQERKKEHP